MPTRSSTSRSIIFDANIYYPFANTLAYSENLIGSAFFAAPIIWLTGNLVLAMNLAALITLRAVRHRRILPRRAGCTSASAARSSAALIFAFAPPRFFRLGQLHMTAVQWIPFSLALPASYLERASAAGSAAGRSVSSRCKRCRADMAPCICWSRPSRCCSGMSRSARRWRSAAAP